MVNSTQDSCLHLATVIQNWIIQHASSPHALALKGGVSPATVYAILSGKRKVVSWSIAEKMSKVLELPLDCFFEYGWVTPNDANKYKAKIAFERNNFDKQVAPVQEQWTNERTAIALSKRIAAELTPLLITYARRMAGPTLDETQKELLRIYSTLEEKSQQSLLSYAQFVSKQQMNQKGG